MNSYLHMKEHHRNEFNDFPIAFAFSSQQFKEGLEKLGATTKNICTIPGGGFIKKRDKWRFLGLVKRHNAEMDRLFEADQFLIGAIEYELGNHEFCITHDPEDTARALGLDMDNPRVNACFREAERRYLSNCYY